jgi:hypothetical protein
MQVAAMMRRNEGKQRGKQVRAYLRNLEAMGAGRLAFLAHDETFPLEVISESLVASSLPYIAQLAPETKAALLARLDRRKARRWRKFRNALG